SPFRSLRSLFGGLKSQDANRVSGIYELYLRKASETGAQRRQRKVLDTSATYVRGEENLNGWRPRGDSLIFDHQWELEKLTRLEMVERCRHVLHLREKLAEQNKSQELSKLDKEVTNKAKAKENLKNKENETEKIEEKTDDKSMEKWEKDEAEKGKRCSSLFVFTTDGDKDKELMAKCLRLILYGRLPASPPPVKTPMNESVISITSASSDSDVITSVTDSLGSSMITSSASSEMFRPNIGQPSIQLSKSCDSLLSSSSSDANDRKLSLPIKPNRLDGEDRLHVPYIEEVRVSPVVSKKGYLNFLEEKHSGWMKKWVVVRRPYIYIYNSEKDPVERSIINLATSQIEYSEDQQSLLKTRNTFSVLTKHRGFLMQTLDDKDFHDWLYAINPLLAGQIRSTLSRRKDPVLL
ncbi:kinesin family member 1, partial [Mytilus galloprovincialis]